jgi:uncharacterized protein
MSDILRANLLSPIVLAFVLGVITKLIRSEFSLPKDLYSSLGIYLLFAIGIKGGVELGHSTFDAIARPAAATLLLGCLTPVIAYFTLRRLGRFNAIDSAAIAAHYGSVSAVTFIAAQQFVQRMGAPAEGFMPTLLTLLESPGIHIALGIGAVQRMKMLKAAGPTDGVAPAGTLASVLHEVLTARTMVLLVGGLLVGLLMGEAGWVQVKPFFDGGFKGALTVFILEMGIIAASRLEDLKKVGPFLLGFGMLMPVVHGALGAVLGTWAGLSVGGATVLATMAASASYIAAPPAVRVQLPEANPTLYLTSALAITFPFNVVVGIPLYFKIAQALHGA